MLDFSIGQIFELLKHEPGSGLLNSILLILIWLNVRSLKYAMVKIEEGHDKRIGALEVKAATYGGRLDLLEKH